MKKLQSKQAGFTLIELIVVIVILGIMSAIAVPQFINLQQDARFSVAEGLAGSLRSGATLSYSKSLIEAEEGTADQSITTSAGAVTTDFGYPDSTAAGIGAMVTLDGDITPAYGDGSSGSSATFTVGGVATCTVTYTSAGDATTPATVVVNAADATAC